LKRPVTQSSSSPFSELPGSFSFTMIFAFLPGIVAGWVVFVNKG
jgi:hypothetical protein